MNGKIRETTMEREKLWSTSFYLFKLNVELWRRRLIFKKVNPKHVYMPSLQLMSDQGYYMKIKSQKFHMKLTAEYLT